MTCSFPFNVTISSYFSGPTTTTPRRKVAAVKLIWPDAVTDKFVEECSKAARKPVMQKDNIPVSVWKEIKTSLTDVGFKDGWEVVRAKYLQMNDYFGNTLINTGGMIGEFMWPYYKHFCDIHDVPADFTPFDDQELDRAALLLTPSKRSE